ncbi:putative RNA-binding protein 19 isoform X2 [Branchiostoma floridae x Branchiostoma belcheri]
MSRLIVKNLPPSITEHKFQSMFEAVGTVTDCKLKYSKNGQFRHFGFVGFRTHQEAEKAVQQFHNTFLNTVRIQVEFCKDLCGTDTPTPWKQKREKVKELSQTKQKETGKAEKTGKTPAKKEKSQSSTSSLLLGELQDDPEFQEFLQAHQTKATRPTWTDTTAGSDTTQPGSGKPRKTQADKLLFNEEDGDMEEPEGKIEETVEEKTSTQDRVSDMEYLKSKVVQTNMSDSEEEEEKEEEKEEEEEEKEETVGDAVTKQMTTSQKGSHIGDSSCSQHMVRMKGVPYKATEKNIREFFYPLNVQAVKIQRTRKGKGTGVVDVGFASEKDQQEALKRDKDYIGTRFIELSPLESGRGAEDSTEKEHRPWEKKSQEAGDEDESIAESGRLFIRNLPYLCKEEDLEGLFSKYGPLTECHIPIDTFTRRAFGIAFVTFMIPEHAVTAFSQLDGTVFMGRLLHILPARGRGQGGGVATGGEGDFKKKKESEQKAKAGSSHNWNSLFLGENAVADVMAERYGTSKSHVLDTESRESLAVRMALGETQIVAETRQFLLDNGVKLDAFSQPAAARSKTVLLVKNLPAGTEASQLQEVFSKFGQLGRVVLPPAGVTGIVEFLEPSEARTAFYRLAYTKFQHVPLYLEWAPTEIFSTPSQTQSAQKEEQESEEQGSAEEEESDSDDDQEPEERGKCTLFLKNLNFDTTEETLKQEFSTCGPVRNVSIATKKDMKNPGKVLSMGYGFVEFQKRESAQKALKDLQHCEVDGHRLELKVSNRALQQEDSVRRKPVSKKKQRSSKILVRNIPFQANKREVQNLFSTFGEIKFVRLPQKFGSTQHRGFGFVEFLSKQDAKRAFNALVHSTHLYGRRLVLEWADTQETVDDLRKKTAEHYHNEPAKKKGKSSMSEGDLITRTQKER